jgi:plasmid stabilization system protein ParE
MRFAFHPEARLEYRDSAAFYAAARPGLGAEFTREVESVIGQICDAPERWRLFEQDARRCLTRRFPFAVLYTIEADYILIVAVMHGSRKPGYWHQRIERSA